MAIIFDFDEWLEKVTLTPEEAKALITAVRTRESQAPWDASSSKDNKKLYIRRDTPTAYVSTKDSGESFIKRIEASVAMKQRDAAMAQVQEKPEETVLEELPDFHPDDYIDGEPVDYTEGEPV